MKNRFLSGIALAFHSMGIYAAVAIIIRMVIAIAKVHEYGAERWHDSGFGDGYSLIILFFFGAFMYRRHRGLSAAVNLSSGKSVVTWSIAAVFISVSFALFDIAMVKEYFSVLYQYDEIVNTFFEEEFLFKSQRQSVLFSADGLLLVIKTAVIYHFCILSGYSVRHIMFTNPKLMIIWVLHSPSMLVSSSLFLDMSDKSLMLFLSLLMLLFAYVISSPVCFMIAVMALCLSYSPLQSVSMMLLMWLGGIAAAVRLVSRYKSDIPKEKRKDMII